MVKNATKPSSVRSFFVADLTMKDVMDFVNHDRCWSFRCYRIASVDRGRHSYTDHFEMFADDIESNQRVVLRVDFYQHSTYISATGLTDYDPVKHCWTTDLGARKTCLDNKRGRKLLSDWRDELWDSRYSWRSSGNKFQFSAQNKDGVWNIYGC